MVLRSLQAINFRNFKNLRIDFDPYMNIFVGDNGHGKTNILEAMYLLIEQESFRYSNYETLIQTNYETAVLRTEFEHQKLNYSAKLTLAQNRKLFTLNEKRISSETPIMPPAILFSPESLSVIKESSEERRKLVDQLVVQVNRGGRQLLRSFRHALKTRNKILKDIATQKIDRTMGLQTLLSVNPSYLKLAAEIVVLRINALNEIRAEVQHALTKINGNESITFDFEYLASGENHKMSGLSQVSDALQIRMQELLSAELQAGASLVGPQKHDVNFLYNGKDSRFYCSQGQQRSIILAFKMAQIVYHHRVYGFYPILLLDDVLSELDLTKQEALVAALAQDKAQTFVTTTDVSLLSKFSLGHSRVFYVKSGCVFVENSANHVNK